MFSGIKKKIAVINQKGGVGKSTTTVSLTYGLALAEKKTLLVDMDPQGHACDIYCQIINDSFTMSQVLKDRRFDIKKTIVPARVEGKVVPNLFVIPSNIDLATTKEEIFGLNHVLKFLDKQLDKILDDFDYIIIDCPPDLSTLTKNAVYTADHILIPIDYDRKALKGVSALFKTIDDVKEGADFSYKILRTLFDPSETIINKYIDDELEKHKEHLSSVIIRKATVMKQAGANIEPIYTFSPTAPIIQDFNNLVKELIDG